MSKGMRVRPVVVAPVIMISGFPFLPFPLEMTISKKQAQLALQGKVDWNPLLEGFFHIPCGEEC
jgi:hypothetical protein